PTYRVIGTVHQQFADSFLHCIAHQSASLLCVGRIYGPCIVPEMLTHSDGEPIQNARHRISQWRSGSAKRPSCELQPISAQIFRIATHDAHPTEDKEREHGS